MRALVRLMPLGLLAACGLESFVDADLGDAPRCAEVDHWPVAWADAEDALLDEIDDLRSRGATCGSDELGGEGPIEPVPSLHCAARLHAGDLIRDPALTLRHEGSDGSTALSRVNAAGYEGVVRQELLAGDFTNAAALAAAWLEDPTYCRALLDEDIEHVGVAQAQSLAGDRIVWVVVTGQERE